MSAETSGAEAGTAESPAERRAAEAAAPEISVVIPIYGNSATMAELLQRLDAALTQERTEYVFVVDGSPDDSLEVLQSLLAAHPRLRIVDLTRNFGQHAALCAGFEAARGDCIIVLDADLQQRPEDIPPFIAKWREGADFVSGWRTIRRDPLHRRLGSIALNRLVRKITGVALHDWGCPLAAIDRSVIERVPACGEQRRFLKPLVAKLSKRPTELRIEGFAREGSRSAYSSLALLGVTLDFAVSFSSRPFLKLLGLGAAMVGLGVLLGLLYFGLRLLTPFKPYPPAQVTSALLALFGAQFIIVGSLGEFTHRIYRLVQGEPLFDVRAVHAADQTEAAVTNEESRVTA